MCRPVRCDGRSVAAAGIGLRPGCVFAFAVFWPWDGRKAWRCGRIHAMPGEDLILEMDDRVLMPAVTSTLR